MWIASKWGWFSIVSKDGHFHVRARKKSDLEALFGHTDGIEAKIETWPDADYRYRVRLPEESDAICGVFAALCCSVDYSNFKSMIAASPTQRDKLHSYHRIWDEMYRHQREHERDSEE